MRRFLTSLDPAACWLLALLPVWMLLGKAPTDIALSLVALLFLARSIGARDFAWAKARWMQALLILWGYMLLNSLFSADISASLGRSAPWIRYVVFAAAVAYLLRTYPHIQRRLIVASFSVAVLLMADGWWQYVHGTDVIGRAIIHAADTGHLRLTGPFSKPILGISLLFIALPVLFYGMQPHGSKPWKIALAIVFYMAVGATVFISGERMALLFFIMICALGIACFSPARRWLLLMAALMLIAAMLSAHSSNSQMERQTHQTSRAITHFSESYYGKTLISAAAIIQQHPLFGVGGKQFQAACERYTEKGAFCPIHAHNPYLEWATEYGAVGLALYIGFILYIAQLVWHHQRFIRYDAIAFGLACVLFIRFWPLASLGSMYAIWMAAPFWLALGWLLARLPSREAL